MKTLYALLTVVAGSLAALPAYAIGNLTVPAIDLTDFYAAAAVLLVALTAIWIAHKVIGFFRGR